MSVAQRKVLLIGWDAADWKIITPLLETGEMPNLEKLINHGTMGNLATLHPVLSPMLWNSIATGVLPDKHGILGFTQVDPVTGRVRPFSTLDRKVKAIWNILSQKGFCTHVVNWFVSHPAEPINGVYVSELFTQSASALATGAPLAPLPQHTVHPPELSEILAEFRVAMDEIDSGQIGLFVQRFMEVDQTKDPHLVTLAKLLAECFTIHAATTWAMENKPWDFMAAYYSSIDHFSHAFMKFHPPRQPHVSEREFEIYRDVVNSIYRLHDLMLGRLLHLAGDDTTVILCSDHGYHSDHLRPRYIQQTVTASASEHRPVGVLALKGPGIKQDALIHGASIIDITPTILHLFGLPIGKDMVGKPLLDAFTDPAIVETIPTWEKVAGAAGMLEKRMEVDATDYDALLKQFVALGYMPRNSGDDADNAATVLLENRWNLAAVYLSSGRLLEALPLLEEVYEEAPLRFEFALHLADCQFRVGLKREAAEVIEHLVATFPGRPMAALCRGMLEFERGNSEAALTHFTALEARASTPTLYDYLGRCYLRLNRIEQARAAFTRAIALDPQIAAAHIGQCRCLLRLGKYEEASQSALTALGINFSLVAGHYYLGMALARLGQLESSARAFETCLRFNPKHGAAQRCLIRVYGAMPGAEEKLQALRQRYMESSQARLAPERLIETIRAQARHRADQRRARRKARDEALLQPLHSATARKPYVPDKRKTFVIVSGLPRSGTSLMMQMLRAGGLQPMTDDQRAPDADNPEGYLEWEEIKRIGQEPSLIEKAEGKALKVISMLLPHLPAGHSYKVLFMDRPVEQIAASQARMLSRNGDGNAPAVSEIASSLHKHRNDILKMLEQSPDVECCLIDYPSLIENSGTELERVTAFLGEQLSAPEKMKSAIRPELYRNRTEVKQSGG